MASGPSMGQDPSMVPPRRLWTPGAVPWQAVLRDPSMVPPGDSGPWERNHGSGARQAVPWQWCSTGHAKQRHLTSFQHRIGNRQPATVSRQPTIDNRQSATGNRQMALRVSALSLAVHAKRCRCRCTPCAADEGIYGGECSEDPHGDDANAGSLYRGGVWGILLHPHQRTLQDAGQPRGFRGDCRFKGAAP